MHEDNNGTSGVFSFSISGCSDHCARGCLGEKVSTKNTLCTLTITMGNFDSFVATFKLMDFFVVAL